MSDAKAAMQDEPTTPTDLPGRARLWRVFANARMWRVFAKVCVLALLLGAGWLAGAKAPEIAHLAQVSSNAWAQAVAVEDSLARVLARIINWAAPHEGIAKNAVASTPVTASLNNGLDGFAGKLEQIRAASERAAEESRRSADRVASAMESNSQQLATRVADLGERLDRIERGGPIAAGQVLAKLEQLSDHLDRIEHGAAVALKPAPPAAPPTSATQAARSATGPVEAPKSAASTGLNVQGLSEERKITNWVVREVINGKAILQGPRGVIRVSEGDLVRGIGRVQSIARQRGRWIITTNNGVIGAR
jgi:hypothetical protein